MIVLLGLSVFPGTHISVTVVWVTRFPDCNNIRLFHKTTRANLAKRSFRRTEAFGKLPSFTKHAGALQHENRWKLRLLRYLRNNAHPPSDARQTGLSFGQRGGEGTHIFWLLTSNLLLMKKKKICKNAFTLLDFSKLFAYGSSTK